MKTTIRLYSLKYNDARTYLASSLFIIGNILLPQLFHLVPQGGTMWLPIYFFTLVGAYKYGWRVGLLTAAASPLVNSLLFSMPPAHALPAIILKSALLAIAAGVAARRFKSVSIPVLTAVVAAYQSVGTLGEWVLSGDLTAALQDFHIGIPGMLLQIVGGYLCLTWRSVTNKSDNE